jgi:hypothetical protein
MNLTVIPAPDACPLVVIAVAVPPGVRLFHPV